MSTAEDQAFSKMVLEYNNEKDAKKKEELKSGIYDRVKVLVFRLSIERLYMTEEEAMGVFELCQNDMDSIVTSYRISNATFNTYLSQVCRYRARRLRREDNERTMLEYSYVGEDTPGYHFDDYSLDGEEEMKLPPSRHRDVCKGMDLRETFVYIVSTRNRLDYPAFTAPERILRKELISTTTRKELLSFLLTLPDRDNNDNLINFARVFCTDEAAFLHLEILKREEISRKSPAYQNSMDLAAMHWKAMTRLKNSMYTSESEKTYTELQRRYRWQAKCHRDRLMDAQHARRGMTQSELGAVLGVSRSTISHNVKKSRELLTALTCHTSVRNGSFGLSS